jgi:maltoporin
LSALQVLDLRWLDVPLGRRDFLNFWAAYGQAPAGTAAGLDYKARNGALGSVRWRRTINEGFNDLTIGYGENVLEGINLYGNSAFTNAAAASREGRPQRWRAVNAFTKQLGSRWAIQAGGAAQFWDERLRGQDSRGQWWSVGARPIYFWTKYYQLAFEAGHSRVKIATEKNPDGSPLGTRQLTRLTIAPQIAPAPNFWARPVLRLFYTRSFWNGANRANMALNAPSFAGSLSGHSIGVQAEAWF